jgi:DNA-binding response OmpR family regulator
MTNPISVLIVDDEEMIRRILCDFLEDEGFSVFGAETGVDAVERIAQGDIDVAIVDMRLPDMDGNTCIKKAMEKGTKTVFFVHTGSHDYSLTQELQDAGMDPDNIFYKPVVDMAEVVEKITAAVSR